MANIAIFSKNPDSHLSENIPTTHYREIKSIERPPNTFDSGYTQ